MSQELTTQPKALPKLAGQEADPQAILKQYLEGKRTEEIAQTFGVTRQGLGYWLRKHAEEDWKEAQVILASERKEQAEDEFNDISKRVEGSDREERERLALHLSLARERLKAAQWDLERVCRRIYGDDKAQAVQSGTLTIEIRGLSATNAVQHGGLEPLTIDHSTQAIDK